MCDARFLATVSLLLLCACGKPDADDKAAAKSEPAAASGVTLSADQIKSLGITTVPAATASYHQQISGFGVVTALDTIAQIDADFMTAQAAAEQSQAAAARARSLSTGDEAAVSQEVVETAQSKAAADRASLELARRKTEAAFGLNAPWRDATSRRAIMARLASGRTVLVRVTFPAGALGGTTPKALQIVRIGAASKSWSASTIWDAPADANFPGRGFYVLVDGSDLAQNERITATIPVGAAQPGVRIPSSALVYGESDSSVFVQTKPGSYLRTKIDTDLVIGDGYFVPEGGGIRAGQAVVVSGAGLLLARETNPSTQAAD